MKPYEFEYRGHTAIIKQLEDSVHYTARRDPMKPAYIGIIEGLPEAYGDTIQEVERRTRFIVDHEYSRGV